LGGLKLVDVSLFAPWLKLIVFVSWSYDGRMYLVH